MPIEIKHRYTGDVLHVVQADSLSGADLSGADLSGADLSDADLSRANLRDADLRAFGDMKYLKTLQIETWMIGYTHDTLQIGCQRHPIVSWRAATPEWLAAMSEAPSSAEWAGRLLPLVLAIIDASPALSLSAEVAS